MGRSGHFPMGRDGEATLEVLLVLLRAVIEVSEGPDRRNRLFRKAIAFIDAHIHEAGLCPELIARQVGVSVRGGGCIGCLLAAGWWSRSTSKAADLSVVPRFCVGHQSGGPFQHSVVNGALAITSTQPSRRASA